MSPEIVVGLLGFAGVILSLGVTQWFLHRRWARDQDLKRDEVIRTQQAQRRVEATEQAEQRRKEQREILERMSEQNNRIIDNAVSLADQHRLDADAARQSAAETAAAHAECRQEVAVLSGKVEELRTRMVETERTSGRAVLVSEHHQRVKHKALNALAASEGYMTLVEQMAGRCTCHALDSVRDLREAVHPRMEALLEENLSIGSPEPQPQE